MPRYEYSQGTLKDATALGLEGWRIVCSVDHPRGTQFVMERELPPPEPAQDEREGAALAKPEPPPTSASGSRRGKRGG